MKLYRLKYSPNGCSLNCGPAALSIITGKTVETCHARALKFGFIEHEGTHFETMQKALRSFGYDVYSRSVKIGRAVRWQKWWSNRTKAQFETAYLIHIGDSTHADDHWVVAYKNSAADNQSHVPVPIGEIEGGWWGRRLSVYAAYRIIDKKA